MFDIPIAFMDALIQPDPDAGAFAKERERARCVSEGECPALSAP